MTKNILLIEDNILCEKLMIDLLKNNGYNILSAREHTQAFTILNNNTIDLILLDIQLPKFLDQKQLT